ncbi:MAG: aminoacyl-tRNA hydrolase [Patescibacteria group bacterium]|nr:aminoacyl-tRNA hydrolase [Patescibacteria group bacterium]
MKLVVGLGNPGKEYEGSRHNVGFLAVDALAEANGAKWKTETKHKAKTAKVTIDDSPVLLAKPMTFMNLSGHSVSSLAKYYKIKPKDILIIQDELDLDPGSMRFTEGGKAGGHHGLESIQEMMPDVDFARLRIGVGKPKTKSAGKDWVLTKPKGKEAESIAQTIEDAAGAMADWIIKGLEASMNTWNTRR